MPHDPSKEMWGVRHYRDFWIYLRPGDAGVDPYLLLQRDGSEIDIPLADLRHLLDKLAECGADLAQAIAESDAGQRSQRGA